GRNAPCPCGSGKIQEMLSAEGATGERRGHCAAGGCAVRAGGAPGGPVVPVQGHDQGDAPHRPPS
ncbi:SEC-C domain-containing protein, partial [Eubacteriales bacterium OttesenSCG-928-A19]|nr:SEC-C domain-containing protein [Eubacteriales bacterium OttesenSCG-928-A19]